MYRVCLTDEMTFYEMVEYIPRNIAAPETPMLHTTWDKLVKYYAKGLIKLKISTNLYSAKWISSQWGSKCSWANLTTVAPFTKMD